MLGPLDVHRALLERSIPHEMVQLRRPLTSADDLPEALGLPAAQCAVVRVLALTGSGAALGPDGPDGPGLTVAVLVPAGSWPAPAAIAKVLGVVGLRRATSVEASAATEYAATLTSPVGLPADVRLLVDSALAAQDVVYAATGAPGVALGIRVEHLLLATGAVVADLGPSELPSPDGLSVPA